jgi:hypothetical protein
MWTVGRDLSTVEGSKGYDMITEFIDDTAREVPRGQRVIWVDIEGGAGCLGWAVKSPLTGAWLVCEFSVAPECSGSVRVNTLRGARAQVCDGNGKRYGGHSSIGTVLVAR